MDMSFIIRIAFAVVASFVTIGIPVIKDIKEKEYGDVKLRLIIFAIVAYIFYSSAFLVQTAFQKA